MSDDAHAAFREGWGEAFDWSDEEMREFAIDHLEGEFATALYVEDEPPAPKDFVTIHAAAIPELDEPEMPKDVQAELLRRCIRAQIMVEGRNENYRHYRDIYTPEAREAARARRQRSKEGVARWIASEYLDSAAFRQMTDAIEEMHAERGARS